MAFNNSFLLKSPVFSSRYKFIIHVIELFLVVAAMGLSVPRLFAKNQPRTRANTIALGMGAKSLMFILYQLLTEHVKSCRRWHSYKANTILNSLEIVFWAAVVFLLIQANIKICNGYTCYLSWAVTGLAIILSLISVYTAAVSFKEFYLSRHRGELPLHEKSDSDSEEVQARVVHRVDHRK